MNLSHRRSSDAITFHVLLMLLNDTSFGRQARDLSLILSFYFVNEIRSLWKANLSREQAITGYLSVLPLLS